MALDLTAYKPVPGTAGDANQVANGFTAIEAFVNAFPPASIAGYPADATKFLRGDGTWAAGVGSDGWVALAAVLTYSTTDGPTFVVTSNIDLTGTVPVGARLKVTHAAATKYFIVTAVAAGTLTLYGGTDFTLAAGAITAPWFSTVKTPLGFNTSPAKWRETMTNTSAVTQATPTNGQWYNFGTTLGIFMPVGSWRARFKACGIAIGGVGDGKACGIEITLSTSLAGETNLESTGFGFIFADSVISGIEGQWTVEGEALLSTAARTTICLMARSSANSEASIQISGTTAETILTLESAYL